MPAVHNLKVFGIGGRTDNAGAAQTDVDQEELRLLAQLTYRQGITPNLLDATPNLNAWRVRQNTGADMNVRVGSTTTQRDGYLLRGNSAGQGAYLVRLDATFRTIAVPATDPTNPARYGVFLFVNDATYSGTASRAYADITCIRGTPAGSPVTPSADATWSAWALIWEFQLPALATAVTDAILDSSTSFDRRVHADLAPQNILENQVFA